MSQITFNHQRGSSYAGAVGNITYVRVYVKSSFVSTSKTTVVRCQGATIKEDTVEPVWPSSILFGLSGEWKPSEKNKGWNIGKIPLEGDGLYFLEVDGYADTFFEVIGQDVLTIDRKHLRTVVERLFGGEIAAKRAELASIETARSEEREFELNEAKVRGWPSLSGSDKQIAWALSIRSKAAKRNPTMPELTNKTAAKYWIENHS